VSAPTGPLPTTHVLAHVRDTLATDERVGELGLLVLCEPEGAGHGDVEVEAVVVRGTVSTEGRKAGVVDVVVKVLRAHGLHHPVRDETEVPCADGPGDEVEAL
jgi:hypothetical protein